MRRWPVSVLLSVLVLAGTPARAENRDGPTEMAIRPSEPARQFPPGFVIPVDAQSAPSTVYGDLYRWSDPRMGGWGGDYPGSEACPADHVARTPVVFVHGTGEEAETAWRSGLDNEQGTTVSVRRKFLEAGWCAAELWAPSYTGGRGYLTYNDANAEEVYQFIQNVLAYTGASRVDVVAHSLGVTVVRKAIRNHFAEDPAISWMRNFVAVAGPNHGSTVCRGLHDYTNPCFEMDPMQPAWLDDLNSVGETPPGHNYLVLYDSLADQFFLGPDARSPRLDGACNADFPGTMHLGLARGPKRVPIYRQFLLDGTLPPCAA